MTTVSDLTARFADALGLPRRLVEDTAQNLREAKMLAASDAPATIEHAVSLLLGLMVAPTPRDAPDCARLYRQLPLDHVIRGEETPDGRTEMQSFGEPSPLMGAIRERGDTFGDFLVALITDLACDGTDALDPLEIAVGGGPGTATATVMLHVKNQPDPILGLVKFTLAPLGGGRHPDDAPRARLDCHATVPGTIFAVFREFFAGSPPAKLAPHHTGVSPEERP